MGVTQPQKGYKFTEFSLELEHPFLKTMFLISRNVKNTAKKLSKVLFFSFNFFLHAKKKFISLNEGGLTNERF